MSVDPDPDGGREGAGLRLTDSLRRHWMLVVGTTLAAAAIAAALALSREPTYRAGVQLLFTAPGPEFGVLGLTPTGGDPAREAATNVVRVRSLSVATAAARELDEDDPEALRDRITVWNTPETNVVDVAADGPSPEAARETALVYARTFARQQRESEVERARAARQVLEQRYDDLSGRARRLERGLRLRDQIEQLAVLEEIGTGSPRLLGRPGDAARVDDRLETIALGGLLGLTLGAGLAFLRASSDRRLRTDEELEGTPGVPVLATIPRSRALRAHARFSQLRPRDAEAFRRLHARLRFSPDPPRVVVVTSARDGEGKTTVAANLAAAAAAAGDRVLLVEADLRGRTLSDRLRLKPAAGLLQVLEGLTGPESAMPLPSSGADDGARLYVLVSGGVSERAPTLLQSARMEELVEDVRDRYSLVVIDTPPIGSVADAIPLLRYADGVLLSTVIGRSQRAETLRLAEEIADMGATVLGIVVNGGGRAARVHGRGGRSSRRPRAPRVREPSV